MEIFKPVTYINMHYLGIFNNNDKREIIECPHFENLEKCLMSTTCIVIYNTTSNMSVLHTKLSQNFHKMKSLVIVYIKISETDAQGHFSSDHAPS